MSWLAPFAQVGLRNVLPVDAHAVYVLPGTKKNTNKSQNWAFRNLTVSLWRLQLVSTRALPAFVTADHVTVIMGEATDATGDVSPIAAVFGRAERGAPGRFILGPWTEGYHFPLTDQHGGWGGSWRRRWGPRPIIVVLKKQEKDTGEM